MSGERRRGVDPLWLAGGLLWLAAVGAGMAVLLRYASTPGDPGAPAARWPSGSRIPAPHDRPALVMVIHPRCPCTRASLGELALLMARCKDRVAAHIIVIKPDGVDDAWWQSDLWRSASRMPGVDLFVDGAGEEARRFGAATSGLVLLYDARGDLVFSGGITDSRGHSGDNEGRSAVVAWLEHGTAPRGSTSVFGCALREPATAAGGKAWSR